MLRVCCTAAVKQKGKWKCSHVNVVELCAWFTSPGQHDNCCTVTSIGAVLVQNLRSAVL